MSELETSSSISKSKLLVLGNSHVRYLLGGKPKHDEEMTFEHENFIATGQQIGDTGATIWGLDNKDSKTNAGPRITELAGLYSNDGQKHTAVCLALGEVDVRDHVYKNSKKSFRSTFDVISDVLDKYDRFLLNDRNVYVEKLFLMGTVPYTREFFTNTHPIRCAMRYIPQQFNALLYNMCKNRGYHYVDAYEGLIDGEGYLRDECSADFKNHNEVHLNHIEAAKVIVPQIEKVLA